MKIATPLFLTHGRNKRKLPDRVFGGLAKTAMGALAVYVYEGTETTSGALYRCIIVEMNGLPSVNYRTLLNSPINELSQKIFIDDISVIFDVYTLLLYDAMRTYLKYNFKYVLKSNTTSLRPASADLTRLFITPKFKKWISEDENEKLSAPDWVRRGMR